MDTVLNTVQNARTVDLPMMTRPTVLVHQIASTARGTTHPVPYHATTTSGGKLIGQRPVTKPSNQPQTHRPSVKQLKRA